MDIHLLAASVAQKVRRDGCRATVKGAIAHLTRSRTADDFDVKHGTDTGGRVPLWKFRISSPNRSFGLIYAATPEQEFADAVSFMQEDPQNITLIDLGCGKGKVLLLAANSGFKQVIGVEFVHELAEIAKKNLKKMRLPNAVVTETDATEFRFPNCDMVVYLYHPFTQEVVQKVVANLRECLSKKIYVIYNNPVCSAIFDRKQLPDVPGLPSIKSVHPNLGGAGWRGGTLYTARRARAFRLTECYPLLVRPLAKSTCLSKVNL